jgi:hypothetical protein
MLTAKVIRTGNLLPAQALPDVSLAEALLPHSVTNVPLALKVCDIVRRWRW